MTTNAPPVVAGPTIKVGFCYFWTSPVGGSSMWLIRMLPRLRAWGIDPVAVNCALERVPAEMDQVLKGVGIPVRKVMTDEITVDAQVDALLHVIAEEGFHVLVADHALVALLAGYWCRPVGVPTVLVMRADTEWYWRLAKEFVFEREACRCGGVVSVSREIARRVNARLPTGVLAMCRPSSVPLPAVRAVWNGTAFQAVYLGRFENEQKRILDLTEALCELARTRPWFRATLYGDGPLRKEVEARLVREPHGRVRYGGVLAADQVFAALADAQALVLLSAFEGFSTAVQEAMSVGLPVCLRRTASGIEGALRHGDNAWLLDADADLAEAMDALGCSETLWQSMADAARRTAEIEFSIDSAARCWGEFLRDLGRAPRRLVSPPTRIEIEQRCIEHFSSVGELEFTEADWLVNRSGCWVPALSRYVTDRRSALDLRWNVLKVALQREILSAEDFRVLHDGGMLEAQFARWLFCEAVDRGWTEEREIIERIVALEFTWTQRCRMFHALSAASLDEKLRMMLAQKLADDAGTVPSSDFGVRYNRASLREAAGQLQQASEEFSALLEIPDAAAWHAGCHFHLGRIALRGGRVAAAQEHLQRCLIVIPEHHEARRLLKRCEA